MCSLTSGSTTMSSTSKKSLLRKNSKDRQHHRRKYSNSNGTLLGNQTTATTDGPSLSSVSSSSSSSSQSSFFLCCIPSIIISSRNTKLRLWFWFCLVLSCCWSIYTIIHGIQQHNFVFTVSDLDKERQQLATSFFDDSKRLLLHNAQMVQNKITELTTGDAASIVTDSNTATTSTAATATPPLEELLKQQRERLAASSEYQHQPQMHQDSASSNLNEQLYNRQAQVVRTGIAAEAGASPATTTTTTTTAATSNNDLLDFSNINDKHHHAIIIPYRDRKYHLEQFIDYMGPYLERNFPHDTFELWLIEQDDSFLFNRAWLANVGITNIKLQSKQYHYQQKNLQQHLIYTLQQQQSQYRNNAANNSNTDKPSITVPPPPTCIILHDVDLIPTVDGVPYTNCSRPIQLGSELAHFNDSIPYPIYTGGVGPAMTMEHWSNINGMSNDFFGWGGEDDELWHRLRLTGLLKKPVRRPTPPPDPSGKRKKFPKFWPPEIERPPKGRGKFRPISEAQTVHHNSKSHGQWARIGYMLELMQNNSARWKTDGLNDMRMTITGDAMTVTHLDSIFEVNNETKTTTVETDRSVIAISKSKTTTITKKHYVTAKQPGSIVSSLSVDPSALASFVAIHHIRAIPKITPLEFIHVTQTDGGRIERAGASGGVAWGACHYHHALEKEMNCPDRAYPELEGKARQYPEVASHTPWHSPLQDFEENPYKGRPTFAVVRHPYDRLIDFYYCPWNGYKGPDPNDPRNLNTFIQHALYPRKPQEKEEKKEDQPQTPPPKPPAFLHLRPQFHYVFANNEISDHSQPFVTHILRYENLEMEFPQLMKMYGIDDIVKLPMKSLSVADREGTKLLTPNDFNDATLRMIHMFYWHDFKRFGYKLKKVPPRSYAKTWSPGSLPEETVKKSVSMEASV